MTPVFIFSLPRSGSTLLQRILATSDHISTTAEPWILLPFVYLLKPTGISAEYWHDHFYRASQDFFLHLPDKSDSYKNEVRSLIQNLYTLAAAPDAHYFLDKTPRYHLIVNEIIDLFPDGKFIFLWRNPLAVVSSMVHSWFDGRWRVKLHHIDLFDGVTNLVHAYLRHTPKICALKYEDLLNNTTQELDRLCAYLEIDPGTITADAYRETRVDGAMGDHTGDAKFTVLSQSPIDQWKSTFNNPYRRRWAKKYLQWIGSENLKVMGYTYSELITQLKSDKNKGITTVCFDLINVVYAHLSVWYPSTTRKYQLHTTQPSPIKG